MLETLTKKLNCILLVGDYEFSNIFNRKFLERSSASNYVYSVKNGKQALDFLLKEGRFDPQSAHTIPKPDLIFLDINMPIMDGWEFLKEFKQLSEHFKDIVIIVLTTSPNPDDEQKARSIMDVDGYYVKPLTHNILEEIQDKYF